MKTFALATHHKKDEIVALESDFKAPTMMSAIEQLLLYEYENCDGWEWMRNGSFFVSAREHGSPFVETFEVDLEFEPSFNISKT